MKLITLFAIIFSIDAYCEYRVYQYYVKSSLENPSDKQAKLVTSTLNPVSYVAYHGGPDVIRVDLIRSWMCYGHTGNKKDYCLPPDEEINKMIIEEATNESK